MNTPLIAPDPDMERRGQGSWFGAEREGPSAKDMFRQSHISGGRRRACTPAVVPRPVDAVEILLRYLFPYEIPACGIKDSGRSFLGVENIAYP